MRFTPSDIPQVVIVVPEPHEDERGFFARVWCREEMRGAGLADSIAQVNSAYNRDLHTLRGMHYQAAPHGEEKFFCCLRGSLQAVALDLRRDSPTYLRWRSWVLSDELRNMLYVPRGVALGYLTLDVNVEVLYFMTAPYVPAAARGVRYDDPAFEIAWHAPPVVLSERDRNWPDFRPNE